MSKNDERITFDEAKRLYPDEWIVFTEPRIDASNTEFLDGVVYFHSKNRDLALDKCAEVDADTAMEFTGTPRYRKVTLSTDAEGKSTLRAA